MQNQNYLPNFLVSTGSKIQLSAWEHASDPVKQLAEQLQGFPDWFDFFDQKDSASYKQLGNAVIVGVIYQTMKAICVRDYEELSDRPELLQSISLAPNNPDLVLTDPGNVRMASHYETELEVKPKLRLVN